jgi:hypothetical protein
MEKLTIDELLVSINLVQQNYKTAIENEAYSLAECIWEKRGKLVDHVIARVKAEEANTIKNVCNILKGA